MECRNNYEKSFVLNVSQVDGYEPITVLRKIAVNTKAVCFISCNTCFHISIQRESSENDMHNLVNTESTSTIQGIPVITRSSEPHNLSGLWAVYPKKQLHFKSEYRRKSQIGTKNN